MKLGARIAEATAPVVDLVYPPRCPLCGDGIADQRGLCVPCWGGLVIPAEPSCKACQRPLPSDLEDGLTCAACLQSPPRHDGIAAGTIYNDAARQIVLSYKHGRRIALAPMLARLIAARLPQLDGEWLAVPVPLHRWRLWKRGFNQSALIARELAKIAPVTPLLDGLQRTRQTPSLGGLGRTQRRKTLAGAIRVTPRRRDAVKGAQVLLVDDVMTSGATSDACVKALKKAGAAKVVIGCFSRVLDEAL
ncbi:ComF family protein [Paraurantiacibacter namhicola]|uniref:DNA utilization protein GntX n=1 Tax=Paraurantiacibacter namhicola TaxID=645517 RepID=A0A1C7D959_9SPHN|nr:ComF family protein [Paraurantiacibacter namhicola]ANU08019.1 DNA utilization protein GntX [Paraurantiacibacter namhicola]